MMLLGYQAKAGSSIRKSFGGEFGSRCIIPNSTTHINNNNTKKVNSNGNNVSNIPKTTTSAPLPSAPLFKYKVSVKYTYSIEFGQEATIEFSDSKSKGTLLEQAKKRCAHLYRNIMHRFGQEGKFVYNCQSTLYSFNEILEENCSFTISEGISRRPNFVRAQFSLERQNDPVGISRDTFSKEKLDSISAKHFRSGKCRHYLIDSPFAPF
ncbi:hypothetical protein L5515_010940 [Caenorhabditis briggsae]|uniref:Uncharacterized protein n=1 Tax=Caenorhabditis briggsae TaxID=6238 RepID=A0AAE9A7A3_CAEBR|nr:hypothetical protein L3Y34_003792 [Caenorhabditis briggsae]UMM27829.1 hypothetical protein L5515_010940 [Caenorhabditis briggsae]